MRSLRRRAFDTQRAASRAYARRRPSPPDLTAPTEYRPAWSNPSRGCGRPSPARRPGIGQRTPAAYQQTTPRTVGDCVDTPKGRSVSAPTTMQKRGVVRLGRESKSRAGGAPRRRARRPDLPRASRHDEHPLADVMRAALYSRRHLRGRVLASRKKRRTTGQGTPSDWLSRQCLSSAFESQWRASPGRWGTIRRGGTGSRMTFERGAPPGTPPIRSALTPCAFADARWLRFPYLAATAVTCGLLAARFVRRRSCRAGASATRHRGQQSPRSGKPRRRAVTQTQTSLRQAPLRSGGRRG